MKTKLSKRIIQGALRPLYRWHRRLGIVSVLFVIMLSITGILLNHNAYFGLQHKRITSNWLLALYNADVSEEVSEFGFPAKSITVDRVVLDMHTGKFLGALGPWIMDGVAIILLLLSFSGIYMWSKRWQTARKRKKLAMRTEEAADET